MNPNQELITRFYNAFSQKDYKTMQQCYADNATFNDPIFTDLDSLHVKNMWEMLCRRSSGNFKLELKQVKASGSTVVAQWAVAYTFIATGRKVVNHVKSVFEIADGKIIKHTDFFSFYNWARQAFGFTAVLLGWTIMFKGRVRLTALSNLEKFMHKLSVK